MIAIRKSNDRGHANHGWLDSYHTFSFANYFDPNHTNFRSLRVINEDRIAGGGGFATHGHRDMEIVTYVLSGELEHKDSLGTGSIIRHGEIQRMSAGTGIYHSEFNHSPDEPVHLLQIWILPDRTGIEPSYEQKSIGLEKNSGTLNLIASPDGEGHAVKIHQNTRLYAGILPSGAKVIHELDTDRHRWLQVAKGSVRVNGEDLHAGDGAAISEERSVAIESLEDAEILLFDLA